MKSPEPPQDVRVELRDGRTIPCELVYDGFHDGAHHWVAVTGIDLGEIVSLRAATIPAKTAIVIGTPR